ncbi:hypothetical protein RB653_002664 [Dictyostelium firmibasis]|uniref:PQ-loop repeat-containing protein n=1 Tax=Dictyostelium firmibasis TaxID=79012 RepID=A0AAN7TQX0_9MYCE
MDSSSGEFVCKTDFETSDVVLGFLLTIGIVISFLPQIFVMIFRKNVDGLSVIMCWLNYVNCMGTFVNVLFLNWFIFECCSWMNSWTCFRNLLPVIQLAPPFLCSLVIFALYVVYRPKPSTNRGDLQNSGEVSKINPDSPPMNYTNPNPNKNNINNTDENMTISLNTDDIIEIENKDNNNNNNNNDICGAPSGSGVCGNDSPGSTTSSQSSGGLSPRVDRPLLQAKKKSPVEEFILRMDWYSQPFFWGSIFLSLVLFGIGVGIVYGRGSESNVLQHYSFACGVFALILVFLQWIPQIYTTWVTDEIGSLSLVSVCIQAPGSFLVVFFQIESKQNWSTWVPYLATGIQMIVLIVICVYYLIRDRKKNKKLKEEKDKIKSNQNIENISENYQTEIINN